MSTSDVPDLHVADVCTITGVVMRHHVANVSLHARFEMHGRPAKQYTHHVVMLYTDNHEQHPLLVGVFDPLQPQSLLLPVRITPAPPTLLMARWFARAYSAVDGLRAQELVACGSFAVGDTSRVRLVDMDNCVQATLHVSGWPFRAPSSAALPVNRDLQTMVAQVAHAYARVRPAIHADNVFFDIRLPLADRAARVPLLLYALHATNMRATSAGACAFFEHAIRVVSPSSSGGDAQLLADVLTLLSLCWVYRADVTRTGADVDQWASIQSVPGGTDVPIAFDCEDGAKALLELLYVMQTHEFPVSCSATLRALQALSRRYVGYLAICELKSSDGAARKLGMGGDDYCNHAMGVMLRRDARDRDLLPITLESTAYCSGAWRRSDTHAVDESAYMSANGRVPVSDVENARVKSPVSMVEQQHMYRRLFSLITCTAGARADRAHHILLNVDMCDFLLDGGDVAAAQAVYAVDMSTADFARQCAQELRLLPACRFPVAPSATAVAFVPGAYLLPPGAGRASLTAVPVTSDASLYMSRA